MGICNSCDSVIVIFKVWSWEPLLVVEGKEYLDWSCFCCSYLLLGYFLSSPKPRKWWYNALEALFLLIPISSDFSVSLITYKSNLLDSRVVNTLSNNVNGGTAFRLRKWWLNFFETNIIVSENQWSASKLLTIQSNINVVLKITVRMVLPSCKLRNFTNDLSIRENTLRTGPVSQFAFSTRSWILFLVIVETSSDVNFTSSLRGLIE